MDHGRARLTGATSPNGTGPLVVELYGPSASGKTTLAKTLVADLGRQGWNVRLISSARPAEKNEGRQRRASLRRLSKLFGLAAALTKGGDEGPGGELLSLLPPSGVIYGLRFRRYMIGLGRAMRLGSDVILLDQGYLSAVGTLWALHPRKSTGGIGRALDLVPRPDVALRLGAPRAVLCQRLQARLNAQGWLERRMELDINTTLNQIAAFDEIDAELERRGIPILRAESQDPVSAAVSKALSAAHASRGAGRSGEASAGAGGFPSADPVVTGVVE